MKSSFILFRHFDFWHSHMGLKLTRAEPSGNSNTNWSICGPNDCESAELGCELRPGNDLGPEPLINLLKIKENFLLSKFIIKGNNTDRKLNIKSVLQDTKSIQNSLIHLLTSSIKFYIH